MKFNFELFTATGGSYAEKVSIRSNGTIGLSQGLMRRRKLTEGQWFAQLYYDAENNAIGIKFIQDKDAKGAVRVGARQYKGADGTANFSGQIASRAFLDFNGIEYRSKKTTSYSPEWNEELGGLVVVLERADADPDDSESSDGEGVGNDSPNNEEPPQEGATS